MLLLDSPKKIASEFERCLVEYKQVSFAVAWASTGFAAFGLLKTHASKIRHAIVGTHFHQTHPDFIESFRTDKRVRFVLQADEIFHPKIYLFESKEKWTCIAGSANFTQGGFGKNHEICIAISDADDPAGSIRNHCRTTIDSFWDNADYFSDPEFAKYQEVWKRHQSMLNRASGRYGSNAAATPIEKVPLLTLTWDDFVSSAPLQMT